MPKLNLGRVRGEDAGFGNITASYTNDGGEPSVSIETSGPETAKDFNFDFANLVNDPLSSSEIDQISNDQVVESANTLNGTGLTTLWARLKEKFSPKKHTHSAEDITAGQLAAALIANGIITEEMLANGAVATAKLADKAVTAAKIADGAVGQEQLDEAVWDSISQVKSALVPLGKVTIGDDGAWAVPTTLWPDGMTAGNAIAAVTHGYDSTSPKVAFSATPRWVIGTPGQVISNLNVRFFWLV